MLDKIFYQILKNPFDNWQYKLTWNHRFYFNWSSVFNYRSQPHQLLPSFQLKYGDESNHHVGDASIPVAISCLIINMMALRNSHSKFSWYCITIIVGIAAHMYFYYLLSGAWKNVSFKIFKWNERSMVNRV